MLNTATTMKWKLTQHHHYHTDHTTEATSAALCLMLALLLYKVWAGTALLGASLIYQPQVGRRTICRFKGIMCKNMQSTRWYKQSIYGSRV